MQNQEDNPKVSNDDSLTVRENDDGTFTIEWDPNDPKWSMFNGIPEDELQEIIIANLKEFIDNDGLS
jgi:hypothetical protein